MLSVNSQITPVGNHVRIVRKNFVSGSLHGVLSAESEMQSLGDRLNVLSEYTTLSYDKQLTKFELRLVDCGILMNYSDG